MQWYKEGYDIDSDDTDNPSIRRDRSMNIKGELKKVYERKAKGRVFWSVCVADADWQAANDGDDFWATTGLDKPSCREGDVVEFTAIADKKWWKVEASDITVVGTTAPAASSKGGNKAASGGGGWNDPARQKSIVAQSSLKSAIDFLALAVNIEALKLPKASPAKRWDILEGALKEKANEFYNIALNPDAYYEEWDEDDEYNPVGD